MLEHQETLYTELMQSLLNEISSCQICKNQLTHSPRPIVQAHRSARLLIIGQAPGIKVHESGIPWNDASGKRLRKWLGLSTEDFYNPEKLAIMPMGFCYPGKGKSGDLAPRPECAPQWHKQLLTHMPDIQLTLLIGQYAQQYYLPTTLLKEYPTLTQRVKQCSHTNKDLFLLPHPSPRNQLWLQKNPWFETNVIPLLQKRISNLF